MTAVELPLLQRQAYPDGVWVEAGSGETFPVVTPATGETITEVPRLGAAEPRRAEVAMSCEETFGPVAGTSTDGSSSSTWPPSVAWEPPMARGSLTAGSRREAAA